MSTLTIRATDARGRPVSGEPLETLYFSTLDYEPFRNSVLGVATGAGGATLTPPAEPFQVGMVLPVEGFGTTYLYADKAGEGFTGAEGEIDFALEAARTRIARVHRWLGEQTPFQASSGVGDRLAAAEEWLDRACKAAPASEARSAASFASLRESLWAGEMAVLEKARADIARYGWREDFLFGCSLQERPTARKDDLIAGLMNYATVMLHWSRFEPRQGERLWEQRDALVSWLHEHRVTAKGHPLLWLAPLGMPGWLQRIGPNFEAVKLLARGYAYELVRHYRDSIKIWDVINEAHDWSNLFDYSQEQMVELTSLMCDTAREANPEAIRVINSIYLWGQYVAADTNFSHKVSRPLVTPYQYLRNCVDAGIRFEVVGLELYNPPHDMFEISALLERFARFGKPVHITEIGVPSATVPSELDPGAQERAQRLSWRRFATEWHGPWDEWRQAEWIEQFYTLCYSKPYVTAVTNWEFDDLKGGLVHHSGFLRSDLTSKLSYHRLKHLIIGWGTERKA